MKIRRVSLESPTSEMNANNILLSPVTLQMQKHLLSSTIQTLSDPSGTGKGRSMLRNGSCSPTPALSYTPTPSPSPFNSFSALGYSSSDLSLSLSSSDDSKSINFLSSGDMHHPTSGSGFVDIDVCDAGGRKQNLTVGPVSISSSGGVTTLTDISPTSSQFSPQLELNSVLNFSDQGDAVHHLPVTSHQQQNIKEFIMMDSVVNGGHVTREVVPCSSISILGPSTAGPSRNISLVEMTAGAPLVHQQQPTLVHQPQPTLVHQPQPTLVQQPQHTRSKQVKILPAVSVNQSVNITPKLDPGGIRVVSQLQACPQLHSAPMTSLCNNQLQQQMTLTALPATIVTSHQQLACLAANLSSVPVTSFACLSGINTMDCLPSTSSNPAGFLAAAQGGATYEPYNAAPTLIPNKKRRLLTFLSNDGNMSALDTQISVGGKISAEDSNMIINRGEAPIVASVKKPTAPTLIFSNQSIPLQTHTTDSMSVCIGSSSPSLSKSAQTLIINSDGTPAALITPVTMPQKQTSTLLAPVSAESGLIAAANQILQTNALLSNAPVVGPTLFSSQPVGPTIISNPPQSIGHAFLPNQPVGTALISNNPPHSVNHVLASVPPTHIDFGPVANNSFTVLEPLAAPIEHQEAVAMASLGTKVRQPKRQVPDIIPNNDNISKKPERHSQVPVQNEFVEHISMLKCKLCGFLSSSGTGMDNHLFDEHEKQIGGCAKIQEDLDNWQLVASKEGVKLNCPQCQNIFSSERSFTVHLTEDHQMTDSLAASTVAMENLKRKEKTLDIIREERDRLRQERKKSRQHGFEAYLDEGGQLCIRQVPAVVLQLKKELNDYDQEENLNGNSKTNNTESNQIIDMKATEYLDMVKKTGKTLMEITNQSSSESNKDICDTIASKKVIRAKIGRPKGSRNLGLSLVRKVNPAVKISDAIMGNECGVDCCAVRLKDPEKLSVHRDCHLEAGAGFECVVCHHKFITWPKCALHLWRAHTQDMELYTCQNCGYRSFFKSTMDKHKKSHDSTPGSYLCPECGRGVKDDRQLKQHLRTVHGITKDGTKLENIEKHCCDICSARLCSEKEVKVHKERVHQKKREWLCSLCGFSAFSRSSIDLHVRTHTGDKPYKCKDCDYSASDHNALRRHSFRHGGVKPYKCPYCTYSAIQSTVYKIHLRKKHPDKQNENLFECKECSFVTVQERLFQSHTQQHHKN